MVKRSTGGTFVVMKLFSILSSYKIWTEPVGSDIYPRGLGNDSSHSSEPQLLFEREQNLPLPRFPVCHPASFLFPSILPERTAYLVSPPQLSVSLSPKNLLLLHQTSLSVEAFQP